MERVIMLKLEGHVFNRIFILLILIFPIFYSEVSFSEVGTTSGTIGSGPPIDPGPPQGDNPPIDPPVIPTDPNSPSGPTKYNVNDITITADKKCKVRMSNGSYNIYDWNLSPCSRLYGKQPKSSPPVIEATTNQNQTSQN